MSTSESESQSETYSESESESQSQISPDPVTAGLLDQLREELGRQDEKAIFTCGGTIPITKPGETLRTEETKFPSASEPVTIRWDPASPETPASQAKVVLPLDRDSQGSLEKLVGALEPASFGYDGKNVFDETYRKALKMDTTQFASTFNPYEFGIIDSIAQILLPSTSKPELARGLRAELYKLNVSLLPKLLRALAAPLLWTGLLKDTNPGLLWPIRKVQGTCRHPSGQFPGRLSSRLPAA